MIISINEICETKSEARLKKIVISTDSGDDVHDGRLQGGKGRNMKMRLIF